MDIYHEQLLEHAKHPANYGALRDSDVHATARNPLCGDVITYYLNLDSEGRVTAVKFEGEGCAISRASASLLSEWLIGKDAAAINGLTKETIIEMLGITLSPTRLKCALLPRTAAQEAVLTHQN